MSENLRPKFYVRNITIRKSWQLMYCQLRNTEFGAEIWIGKIKDGNNDHAIKVTGYFGIDPEAPKKNYIIGTISSLTLESIFKAFDLGTPNMPKFLRETGYPEGLSVAYSLEGKN